MVSTVSSVSSLTRFSSSISRLSSSKKDDYEGMKIDKSKLDDKERERIAYIEKLSLEAEDMVLLLLLLLLLLQQLLPMMANLTIL